MATGNLFLKEFIEQAWTVVGGTEAEYIAKETVEPTNPAVAPKFEAKTTEGQKTKAKLKLTAAVEEVFTKSEKLVKFNVFVSAKNGTAGKHHKISTSSPVAEASPEVGTTQAWLKLELSKAQAEELTKKKLEELVITVEHITTGSAFTYEIYAAWESAAGGTTGTLAGSTKVLLGGTAAIAAQGAIRGSTKVVLGGAAAPAALGGNASLAGNMRIVLGTTGQVIATGGLGGTTRIVFSGSASVAAKAAIAGTTKVRLGGTSSIRGTGGGETRHVVLLVFDE
jgi:hypothetical protein